MKKRTVIYCVCVRGGGGGICPILDCSLSKAMPLELLQVIMVSFLINKKRCSTQIMHEQGGQQGSSFLPSGIEMASLLS